MTTMRMVRSPAVMPSERSLPLVLGADSGEAQDRAQQPTMEAAGPR